MTENVPLTGDSLAGKGQWKNGVGIPHSKGVDVIAILHLDRAAVYAFDVTHSE